VADPSDGKLQSMPGGTSSWWLPRSSSTVTPSTRRWWTRSSCGCAVPSMAWPRLAWNVSTPSMNRESGAEGPAPSWHQIGTSLAYASARGRMDQPWACTCRSPGAGSFAWPRERIAAA